MINILLATQRSPANPSHSCVHISCKSRSVNLMAELKEKRQWIRKGFILWDHKSLTISRKICYVSMDQSKERNHLVRESTLISCISYLQFTDPL